MARHNPKTVTAKEGMDILRRKIQQKIAGGSGALLRQFKEFRYQSRSSNNKITFEEFLVARDML